MKTRRRVVQRLPEHGGGTSKKDRLSWLVGALFRMVYGCLIPADVALSVCDMAVELELSGASNPRTLLRMALIRVSVIIYRKERRRGRKSSREHLCSYTGCWMGFEAVI